MSLKFYSNSRLVVLSPDSPALEAARAMENNRVGAILVQDKGKALGIVTDRDLAIRVLTRSRDPRTTTLAEIMSSPLATLSPKNTQQEAIQLMIDRDIRRVPLVEDGRLVGVVTLDDLILDEQATLDQLAEVVEAQLGEGGPAASPRTPARRRSAARAEATYRRLVKQAQNESALDTPEQAETALKIVLKSLIRRLSPGEAKDLIAQLPSLLQPEMKAVAPGPDKTVTRESMQDELAREFGLSRSRATLTLLGVGATIAQNISPGQLEDVHSQLPEHLREVFPDLTPPWAA